MKHFFGLVVALFLLVGGQNTAAAQSGRQADVFQEVFRIDKVNWGTPGHVPVSFEFVDQVFFPPALEEVITVTSTSYDFRRNEATVAKYMRDHGRTVEAFFDVHVNGRDTWYVFVDFSASTKRRYARLLRRKGSNPYHHQLDLYEEYKAKQQQKEPAVTFAPNLSNLPALSNDKEEIIVTGLVTAKDKVRVVGKYSVNGALVDFDVTATLPGQNFAVGTRIDMKMGADGNLTPLGSGTQRPVVVDSDSHTCVFISDVQSGVVSFSGMGTRDPMDKLPYGQFGVLQSTLGSQASTAKNGTIRRLRVEPVAGDSNYLYTLEKELGSCTQFKIDKAVTTKITLLDASTGELGVSPMVDANYGGYLNRPNILRAAGEYFHGTVYSISVNGTKATLITF